MVYFAGHGFIGNSAEYWLLSGAPEDRDEAISHLENKYAARSTGIPNIVLISDACRSVSNILLTSQLKGAVMFPARAVPAARTSDVDVFLAAGVGESAYEAARRDSPDDWKGIYTTCLLEAYKKPYPNMVRLVADRPVLPNRQLRHYLAAEVPKKLRELQIPRTQEPDAEVCSDEPIFIAHVSSEERNDSAQLTSSAPTVADVAAATFASRGLGEATRPLTEEQLKVAAQRTGFEKARLSALASTQLPTQLSTQFPEQLRPRTGAVVFGTRVKSAMSNPAVQASVRRMGHGVAAFSIVTVRMASPAASVALTFADGTGTVIAVFRGYVASVVLEDGRVSNVSYLPSEKNPSWGAYQQNRAQIEPLRAEVAAAAKFGVFRIEGTKEERKELASRFADRIRMFKDVDPTLGIYATYAYADVGLESQVRSVRQFMRSTLQVDQFDVAMMAGALSNSFSGAEGAYPFCPMLSQGWELLRVRGVQLHDSVAAARDRQLVSLWLLLDPIGMSIVDRALMIGRVK